MDVLPVSAITSVQVVPFVLVSTLYPVMGEAPALPGAVQDKSTLVELRVAVSPVGASGKDKSMF